MFYHMLVKAEEKSMDNVHPKRSDVFHFDHIEPYTRDISSDVIVDRREESDRCRSKLCKLFSNLSTCQVWKAILSGQFLAVLLCGTGVTSQYLSADFKINMPTAQSFVNYALLCLIFTTWLACRSGEQNLLFILKSRGWKYLLIGAADVEANYLVVRAYQYTNLTSIQLLDCFTIPVVLSLSFIFLKTRYKIVHILGVGICLLGVGCLVWADIEEGRNSQGPASNKLLGDMLCLSGAVLYGISNVCQEYFVKTYDHIEFLGMIGLFGSLINGIQFTVLERKQVALVKWDQWYVVLALIGFALCLFLLYVCMPLTMRISSATAVNLSVLTADFYSLIIGIFLFQYKYHPLYFASFGLIIIGVIVFFSKSTNPVESSNLRNIVPHTSSVEYSQVPITSELEPSEVRLLSANSDAAGTSKSANYSALKGQTTCSNKQRVTIENSFVEGQKTTVNIENQNTPKRNGIVKPNQTDSNRL